MNGKRKVTVHLSVWFEDMMMESTDAALEIVKGITVTASRDCEEEIKNALELAGAKDITFHMMAY